MVVKESVTSAKRSVSHGLSNVGLVRNQADKLSREAVSEVRQIAGVETQFRRGLMWLEEAMGYEHKEAQSRLNEECLGAMKFITSGYVEYDRENSEEIKAIDAKDPKFAQRVKELINKAMEFESTPMAGEGSLPHKRQLKAYMDAITSAEKRLEATKSAEEIRALRLDFDRKLENATEYGDAMAREEIDKILSGYTPATEGVFLQDLLDKMKEARGEIHRFGDVGTQAYVVKSLSDSMRRSAIRKERATSTSAFKEGVYGIGEMLGRDMDSANEAVVKRVEKLDIDALVGEFKKLESAVVQVTLYKMAFDVVYKDKTIGAIKAGYDFLKEKIDRPQSLGDYGLRKVSKSISESSAEKAAQAVMHTELTKKIKEHRDDVERLCEMVRYAKEHGGVVHIDPATQKRIDVGGEVLNIDQLVQGINKANIKLHLEVKLFGDMEEVTAGEKVLLSRMLLETNTMISDGKNGIAKLLGRRVNTVNVDNLDSDASNIYKPLKDALSDAEDSLQRLLDMEDTVKEALMNITNMVGEERGRELDDYFLRLAEINELKAQRRGQEVAPVAIPGAMVVGEETEEENAPILP